MHTWLPEGCQYSAYGADLRLRAHGWWSSADSSVLVLLDQASGDMLTLDLADRKRDDVGFIDGCAMVQGPARPGAVVVAGVLGQDGAQVPLAEDQHPVGAFGACRAYPPLGKGVRARCPRRDLDHPGVVARQRVAEDPWEFESRSRIRNWNALALSPRSARRLRACWATRAPSGLAVTPSTCTNRVPTCTTKKTNNRRSVIVSTEKKPRAGLLAACARMK